jgi:DNA-binding GntR family transcriptional regulator
MEPSTTPGAPVDALASRRSPLPKPHGNKLLADVVYEQLKREIVECKLLPDEIVVETALAERFNVSKGPVREALKRLAQAGFVRALPRVGYVITPVRVGDIDEIFSLRLAIEPLAVRLAMANVSDAELDRLAQLAAGEPAARNEPAAERGARLAEANRDFHREIARLSGNARLARIVEALVDELERVTHLLALNLDDVADEHPDLVDAMRSGDADSAARTMQDQLAYDRDAMRAAAIGKGQLTHLALPRRP